MQQYVQRYVQQVTRSSRISIEQASSTTPSANRGIATIYGRLAIDRVAAELGETVARIFDLAINFEPEDGVIWIYGPNDNRVIAFSPFGIENLREMIEMAPINTT